MNIFVDIDGTICTANDQHDYCLARPIQKNIDKINKLYDEGNNITYWTARGAGSGEDWEVFTLGQLAQWGCKFHQLFCNSKPSFDMLIDDKAININQL